MDFRKIKIIDIQDFNNIYVNVSKMLTGLTQQQKFSILMLMMNAECSDYILEELNGKEKKSDEE